MAAKSTSYNNQNTHMLQPEAFASISFIFVFFSHINVLANHQRHLVRRVIVFGGQEEMCTLVAEL